MEHSLPLEGKLLEVIFLLLSCHDLESLESVVSVRSVEEKGVRDGKEKTIGGDHNQHPTTERIKSEDLPASCFWRRV